MPHELLGHLWADSTLYQSTGKFMAQLMGSKVRLHNDLVELFSVSGLLSGFISLATVVGTTNTDAVLEPGILITTFCKRLLSTKEKVIVF